MTFHLQTLLDLRRNAEKEARQALDLAVVARLEQQEEQARLLGRCQEASGMLAKEATRLSTGPGPTSAAQATDREHYLRRLREETERLKGTAQEHAANDLATALSTESAAQAAYEEARQAREAVEKLKERADSEDHRKAERRADESAADLAQAAHVRRKR